MQRRTCLIATAAISAAIGLGAQPTPGLATLARHGGVLLIRHASTEAGLGDPAGFTLGQCQTQRNLSDAGRAESRAMGAWFQRHGLQPQAVLSSQWCRCLETARLALGRAEPWPPLNSTFGGQGQHAQQLTQLQARLQALPAGVLEVWVTHQVIMTALTQAYPAMGEGFLVDRQGRLLARGMMAPDA
ncbi:MAG: histidine phosphatase family protein [Limnohabitans sp.]